MLNGVTFKECVCVRGWEELKFYQLNSGIIQFYGKRSLALLFDDRFIKARAIVCFVIAVFPRSPSI